MMGAGLAFAIVLTFLVLTLLRIFVASPDFVGFLATNQWIVASYVFLWALFTFNRTYFEIVKWWGLSGVIAGAAAPTIFGFLGWAAYAELCLTETASTLPFYFLFHRRAKPSPDT